MNYYKQFAAMLGLDLGQEFSIVQSSSKEKSEYVYKITKNGVFSRSLNDTNGFWGLEHSITVEHLISGLFEAVPKKWKPKEGKEYWYYSEAWKHGISTKWKSEIQDLFFWKVGNCFLTKEEAETKGKEIMEKLVKEYKEA